MRAKVKRNKHQVAVIRLLLGTAKTERIGNHHCGLIAAARLYRWALHNVPGPCRGSQLDRAPLAACSCVAAAAASRRPPGAVNRAMRL